MFVVSCTVIHLLLLGFHRAVGRVFYFADSFLNYSVAKQTMVLYMHLIVSCSNNSGKKTLTL